MVYEYDLKVNNAKHSFLKVVEEYSKLNDALSYVRKGKEQLFADDQMMASLKSSVVFLLKDFYTSHTYLADYLKIANFVTLKLSSEKLVTKTVLQSLDKAKNQEIMAFCKGITDFLERFLCARVVKMNFRIAFDGKGLIYFTGSDYIHVKPLISGFPEGIKRMNATRYLKALKECQMNSTSVFKPPAVYNDLTKSFIFSEKLLPKLILNKCGGDFCQFVPTDRYK